MTNIEKSKDSIYQKGFGWTYVGTEMAEKHNIANESFVRKMKRRAECKCPNANAWYCDQACSGCKYHNCGNDVPEDDTDTVSCQHLQNVISVTSLDAEVPDTDGDICAFGNSIPSPEDTVDEAYEKKEIGVALAAALDALEPDERELIRLAFVEGLTDGNIAKRLGIAARTTVSSRKMAILRKLGRQLKNFF